MVFQDHLGDGWSTASLESSNSCNKLRGPVPLDAVKMELLARKARPPIKSGFLASNINDNPTFDIIALNDVVQSE
jgi:hypothetical protein